MPRRLIINADDLGYDPAVTRGIIEAMTRGIVSSTTLMVNGPSSAEAARLAGGLAVGLHLNLARWSAVSQPALALDERHAATLEPAFVERETLAQLDRLHALLGRAATHVDVHKHLHSLPNVLEGLTRAAVARRLPVRSIDPAMRARLRAAGVVTNDVFLGEAGAGAYWTLAQLRAELEALRASRAEGVIELMCHPGYRPETVASGYSAQREVELATFTAPDARDALARLGLVASSWSG